MSSYGEEDDYDDDGDGSNEEDPKSQVVSQHPLSSLGNELSPRMRAKEGEEDDEDENYGDVDERLIKFS